MPSGAKKRKAAKKKMQKQSQGPKTNGAHSQQGHDDTKSHDERESDGGEVERELSEEPVGNYGEEGTENLRLGEGNDAETAKEVKLEENFSDVTVDAGDASREYQNKNQNVDAASEEHRSSSSSSSSSSDDDEVAVEKEKPVVAESVTSEAVEKVEEQGQSLVEEQGQSLVEEAAPSDGSFEPAEASGEKSVTSEAIYEAVEESIPVEESVKEVVSLPQELDSVTESPLENSTTSEVVEVGLKQNVDEVLAEKEKISSAVIDMLQEKIETKMIPVVDEVSDKSSEPVDTTVKEDESLLPPSSGVTTVDRNGNNHVQESEKHKNSEEQPLVSSAPLPVRRTSWMNCCGLFEVLSGGSGR